MTERRADVLDQEQIKALRAANDQVVFRHLMDEDWIGEIEAHIDTLVHGERVRVKKTITVNSSITNYEEGRASDHPLSDAELSNLKLRAGYAENFPNENGGVWQTIARQLKVRDSIQLLWVRGNHNQTTRGAGLAVDELSLRIIRAGRTAGTFKVGYQVGLRNCARMVRSERESYTYL